VDYKSFLLTKFSFDGATKETYEKVRPGVSFDKVVSNIKALDRYKRQRGKLWPKIEFHYLLLKQNLHEAEQFIEFIDSLDINCSGIMFSKLLHYYPEIEGIYTEIPEGLGEKLIEKGKNYGIPVYFNGDTLENKPAANMCTQWLMTYVFPDGTVIPCCNPNEANVRYKQREWSMGNVFETPFREIWEGEKYKKLRKTLMMGDKENYMPVCKNLCAIHNIDKVECF
jgi:MoaA/NifB/PqqE/SkfB family radical SAM enzyme